MVKDKYNGWLFLINDMIAYKGKHLIRESLPDRLELAIELLDTCLTPDPTIDCCRYQVKQYVYPNQEGVNALFDLSKKLPYTSRGMYFYPYTLKYKPKLVNFDETLIKSVVRKVKDMPDFQDGSTSAPIQNSEQFKSTEITKPVGELNFPVISTENNSTEPYMLRKTELPDIYEVYEFNTHSNTTNGRGSKLGTAYIQNMQVSKMMRTIFKDTTVATYVKMLCMYKKDTNKWIPISLID
jgi:hypothetical protein